MRQNSYTSKAAETKIILPSREGRTGACLTHDVVSLVPDCGGRGAGEAELAELDRQLADLQHLAPDVPKARDEKMSKTCESPLEYWRLTFDSLIL